MLRLRRYRLFLAVAIFAILVIYHFTTVRDWEDARNASFERLKALGLKNDGKTPSAAIAPIAAAPPLPPPSAPDSSPQTDATKADPPLHEPVANEAANAPSQQSTEQPPPVLPIESKQKPSIVIAHDEPGDYGIFGLSGQGRHEVAANLENKPVIHWERQPDHFPIPLERVIPLPSQRPIAFPKIQYAFGGESPSESAQREKRRAEIKEAMQHSWNGYQTKAWMHDELSPVSGAYRDPFCAWSATMVDGMDTLWIMGMENEFYDAVKAVADIDFTTSPRKDIPVFETTIRYLGGLLAAYDVSGQKFKVLLDKAADLADVLMGAFDTPNRMPIGYYYWRPTFARNPHRASTRMVMAELGTLSMEFTRLAQLTKNNRYYDAIARITDELEQLQNHTQIPGLWPTLLDASGCRKPERPQYDQMQENYAQNVLQYEQAHPYGPTAPESGPATDAKAVAAAVGKVEGEGVAKAVVNVMEETADPSSGIDTRPPSDSSRTQKDSISKHKRQLDHDEIKVDHSDDSNSLIGPMTAPEKVDCEPQGLESPPYSELETFGMGGQADSTFEYLPKMHLLLGGTVPKYRAMYEQVIDAVNDHMLFRPMVPDNRDLRAIGVAQTRKERDGRTTITLRPELTHLTCFVGGMYGMGAKLFSRPEDLETAKKLTETCVWAYGQTSSGIMPESAQLLPCEDITDCKWDKTKWYTALDPYREYREAGEKAHLESQKQLLAQKEKEAETAKQIEVSGVTDSLASDTVDDNTFEPRPPGHGSRQTFRDASRISDVANDEAHAPRVAKRQMTGGDTLPIDDGSGPVTNSYTPVAEEISYPSHEEYVESRLRKENIPEGIPVVSGRSYILRPEAIESVFYMYRITGDESWREKGWRMWQAIQKSCRSEYGYSAIGDVTETESYQLDEMESFWLGETLKYFYLLFSPPDVINLDEYVLNTEAHPFKRPS